MATRGSTGEITSPLTPQTPIPKTKPLAHDKAEKELSHDQFSPIEYGRYKHSVDHSITHVETRDPRVSENSTTGLRRDSHRIAPTEYPEAIAHREELQGDQPPDTVDSPQQPEVVTPKILGVRKRLFIIVALASGLALIALVAGLAAGLTNSKHGDRQAMPQNLAATNWTVNGVEYQVVLTQDEFDGSLLSYFKTNSSWTQVNISSYFEDSALPIRNQSPLATVAISDPNDWGNPDLNQLRVYFATSANSVVEIVTHDPNLTDWRWGILGPHMNHSLVIEDYSQLAATWRRCSNETECGHGQFFLTYELGTALMVANSTANWDPSIAVDRIDPFSGITLVSAQTLAPYSDTKTLFDTDYAWAIYKDASTVVTAWQDYQQDWNWTDQGKEIKLPQPENSTLQTLAAVAFNDRKNVFLVGLADDDGTAYANDFDPVKWGWAESQPLNFEDAPENTQFSTIAMTPDARLYGISDGVIQEYEMVQSDLYTFSLRSNVSTESP
ncbi:hypothetical protein F5Y18DRAFT_382518 [Xylariaceae sp. FL1019]|nr:hypothetical protein F5Y18DRAFT_382518 [Xylariaceae sp. FL1019]